MIIFSKDIGQRDHIHALEDKLPSLKDNKTKRLYSIKGHVPDKYKKYTGCVFSDRCNDFMKGKCDIIEPNKIKINKNQFVSCFLYK